MRTFSTLSFEGVGVSNILLRPATGTVANSILSHDKEAMDICYWES